MCFLSSTHFVISGTINNLNSSETAPLGTVFVENYLEFSEVPECFISIKELLLGCPGI
jgi:hypothetical protein